MGTTSLTRKELQEMLPNLRWVRAFEGLLTQSGDISGLQEQIGQLQAQLSSLSDTLATVQTDLDGIDTQIITVNANIDTLNATVAGILDFGTY